MGSRRAEPYCGRGRNLPGQELGSWLLQQEHRSALDGQRLPPPGHTAELVLDEQPLPQLLTAEELALRRIEDQAEYEQSFQLPRRGFALAGSRRDRRGALCCKR